MVHTYPGWFLTFEGPDGAGKTSHIQALQELLLSTGREVVLTREPGGSALAEKIRALLLKEPMTAKSEVLLFAAARADHMDQVILPGLRRGAVVLSDRFADSTYAYQAEGRGLHAQVLQLEQFVLEGFEPDYTLFFDITLEESQRRLAARSSSGGESNLFDEAHLDYKRRVYMGYQTRYQQNRHRMVRIDAMRGIEDVRKSVLGWAQESLIPQLSC